jgi:NifU-like protein involved in Fe-S cluster formation
MSSEFEEFNRLLMEEMKKSYSERAIEYFSNPKNMEPMDDASGYAEVADSHGDELYFWIKMEGRTITKASFFTKGCITIKIAASGLTEMVLGKTIEEASAITPKALRDFIGRTPRKTWHCANLAIESLKTAIRNYAIISLFNNPKNRTVQIDL